MWSTNHIMQIMHDKFYMINYAVQITHDTFSITYPKRQILHEIPYMKILA